MKLRLCPGTVPNVVPQGGRLSMLGRWLGLVAIAAVACWAAPSRAASPNWPDAIVLATASEGGTYDIYGEGWRGC